VLGIIHQRQGDTVRAISELKKTVYIDPEFALAHMNLANIYKAQGKFDLAVRAYDNALRSAHKDPEGPWTLYLGGWKADVVLRTCERSLLECRKAMGAA
jgi:chemotaxis protein methyltransferase CheR